MNFWQKIGIFCGIFVFSVGSAVASLPSDSLLGPTASLTANSTSVGINSTVYFDASVSRDARGGINLEYRWDFEGTYDWTEWSRTPKISYFFNTSGKKTTRLQVRDSDKFIDETKLMIKVKDSIVSLPISKFFVEPIDGEVGTSFRFAVDTFSQIGTPREMLEVRWDWDRDGVWDTDWSLSRTFFHVFSSSGSKEVWLQTRDINGLVSIEKGFYLTGEEDDGHRTKEIGRILVEVSGAPRASFRTWPAQVSLGTNIHFDAGESLRAKEYRWDFDGDGIFDTDFSSTEKIQQVYSQPGIFESILEVRTSENLTDRTTRTIIVKDPNNISPEAKFTVRNSTNFSAGGETGVLLDEFYFSAGGCKDTDGSVAKIQTRWDFDGDGVFDTTFSTQKIAKHKFTKTGWFTPKLEIIDEKGGLASIESKIQIVANTPPTANLKISPPIGTRKTVFQFDATGSFDDQTGTSNLNYRFDFESDGVFDTEFKSNKIVRCSFTTLGKKVAIVEVRDHAQSVSRMTVEFEVVDTTSPIAAFSVEPLVGTFNTNFKFDAGVSFDPSRVGEKLKYRWDFDSHGENDISFSTGWTSSAKSYHRYKTIGTYNVHLAVKNSAGDQSDFYRDIIIHEDSLYTNYLRKKGIISSENPDQYITRAELAKMIVRAAKLRPSRLNVQIFTDVEPRDWYTPFVLAVSSRDWISPKKDFSFQPDGFITRIEATKAVISALYPYVAEASGTSSFRDVDSKTWYARFAEVAFTEGLIDSDNGRFLPNKIVRRGEAARMIAKLLEKYDISSLRTSILFFPNESEVSRNYRLAMIYEFFSQQSHYRKVQNV